MSERVLQGLDRSLAGEKQRTESKNCVLRESLHGLAKNITIFSGEFRRTVQRHDRTPNHIKNDEHLEADGEVQLWIRDSN